MVDDPRRRNPLPDPGAPSPATIQVHGGVQGAPIASLPGMPPIPPLGAYGGGVSVHVSNVVAPMPYPYPMQAAAPHPGAAYAQPAIDSPPGVLELMRQDASQKAIEAVSSRGPARVLAFTVGFVMVAVMLVLVALSMFGVPAAVIVLAELPCAAIATGAFVLARRAGRGPGGHALEQAILRVASRHAGVVRVVTLAQETGRPLRECQLAIDAMVVSGHATVDADERGGLVYRIPDLVPSRALDEGER